MAPDYIEKACAAFPATKYPNIRQACFLIALDNGGINRDRDETQWNDEYETWLLQQREQLRLPHVDNWLGGLDANDFDTVCTGEHTEAETLLQSEMCPRFTSKLLNRFFEQVC